MANCNGCFRYGLCNKGAYYSIRAEDCPEWEDKEIIERLLRMSAIKNVRPDQVKHLIVKSYDEFQKDVRAAVDKGAYAFVSCGKVEFFDDIGYRSKYETMSRLSDYYGVEVVAVEPADEVEAKDILIEFTAKKEVQ